MSSFPPQLSGNPKSAFKIRNSKFSTFFSNTVFAIQDPFNFHIILGPGYQFSAHNKKACWILIGVIVNLYIESVDHLNNKGLVMMISFHLTLSEKHFIFPSILNDSFAGYSNLGCRPLPFMTWITSCQSLLACKVSLEKSADSLMGTP